jgi:hypothetical protein
MRGYAAIVGVFRQKRGFLPDWATAGFNHHFKPNSRYTAGTGRRSARGSWPGRRGPPGDAREWGAGGRRRADSGSSAPPPTIGTLRDPFERPNESIVHRMNGVPARYVDEDFYIEHPAASLRRSIQR